MKKKDVLPIGVQVRYANKRTGEIIAYMRDYNLYYVIKIDVNSSIILGHNGGTPTQITSWRSMLGKSLSYKHNKDSSYYYVNVEDDMLEVLSADPFEFKKIEDL